MPVVTTRPPDEVRLTAPSRHDPLLDLFHNTRHASPRHALLRGRQGWEVRSPWLSRFDWVLDAPLEAEPGEDVPRVLTKRRAVPRSVFVKAGLLTRFLDHVLPRLELPATVYVGNGNLPLSRYLGDVHRLAGQRVVHAIFCENKDVDLPLPPVTAMPVGLHPADLLADDGARRLRRLASTIDAATKRARVLVPCGRAAARFGAATAAPRLAANVASHHAGDGAVGDYWESLAGHRFLLAPWGLAHDSPAPFEALVLGTIPILRAGPLAEAYDGLPVVTVEDLAEITPARLDAWWGQHAGALTHRPFMSSAHWWARVAARLPGGKRAFLVLAPESHGSHLVTDLLVHAGCHGRSGAHASWHGEWQGGIDDRQPWDDALPTDQDPIVWRRSVPHLAHWPDIRGMIASLEARGYAVRAIVVHREPYAAIRSQLKWRHVTDAATARANIERAYPYIFAHLEAAAVPATVVGYESLVRDRAAREHLLETLGLDVPSEPLEVWDGNRKWYTTRTARPPVASTTAAAAFPEWWFAPSRPARPEYERCVARGRAQMRETTAVFCGLARDVAAVLPGVIARVEHAGAMFRDYRVVLYENDSADGTVAALRTWASANPRITVLSERLGVRRWARDRTPERMRHLAACRNRYVDYVTTEYAAFDHVVVLDTDLRRGFSYDGLAHTFGEDAWHVVGSNSVSVSAHGLPSPDPELFDAWAFRRVGEAIPRPVVETNRLFFRRGEPLVPVWSAFGGLAAYTMAAFRSGARYGGDDCEHVVLHRELRARGFDRQFLNPSQIVLYVEGS